MEKKVFFILTILLVLSLFYVNAASTDVDTKATECLNSKIDENGCDSLSTEEKIFSLLAVGKCKTELKEDSDSNECWPDSGCTIKTTAQAILAMKKTGSSTDDAEDWLLDQVTDFSALDWFLQIESSNATSCTVEYSDSTYSFSLNEDKTLSKNAGSCLTIYGNYWFSIPSSCYDEEFKISCENSFLTSLLYKKTSSSTIYVSGETNSASGGGATKQIVSSSCFEEGGACNYEGTLWAAMVLKYTNHNITSYLPYLVSMADDNLQYLPESFLYTLTGNYKNELLLKQKENKWWVQSGDKFYDTAVALLPFQNAELSEKTNAKNWLIEIQDEEGCWQGNIRNTAFLLYSLWGKTATVSDDTEDTTLNCENSNYYCLSSSACETVAGNIMSNYTGCFGTDVCCTKNKELETCSAQGGELCSSNEQCANGDTVDSSDSNSAKFCCVDGTCETKKTECETNSGYCKTSCGSSEELVTYDCDSGVCCVAKESSIVWIVVLSVLIVLTALGIIFRKKLKDLFLKIKTKLKAKFSKGKAPAVSQQQKLSSTPSSRVYPGAVQRNIIPNQQARAPARRPVQNKSEFDDVLKKLKEIGK